MAMHLQASRGHRKDDGNALYQRHFPPCEPSTLNPQHSTSFYTSFHPHPLHYLQLVLKQSARTGVCAAQFKKRVNLNKNIMTDTHGICHCDAA